MASTIITKNSSTASAVPVVGDLTKGELAVNVTDKKIYTKDNSAAVVKLVGSLGNQEANAVAITGGSIAGITDLAVADGGTGASTASDARTNLGLGTIATQAASSVTITGGSVTGITDITVADGGTGASTAANARSNLGAAASGANSDITSLSGLTTALSVAQGGTGITSFGSGVATFLGTPSSANLLAAITDETGTGALVFANTPTLVAPILGTPTSGNFSTGTFTWPTFNQNTTGTAAGLSSTLAIASGGTGATTAGGALTSLGAYAASNPSGYTSNTGTVTSVGGTGTVNGLTLTGTVTTSGNLTLGGTLSGVSLTSQVSGTLPTANGGTNLTSFTSGGVVYASSTSALATGSALTFNGTNQFTVLAATGTTYNRTESTQYSTFVQHFATSGGTGVEYKTLYRFVDTDAGEIMRLTSTSLYTASGINVGIGHSNPLYKLDVVTTGNTLASNIASRNTTSGTGAGAQILVGNDSSADLLVIRALSSTYTSSGINTADGALIRAGNAGGLTLAATDASGTIKFASGGATQRMVLDSAGNLGLGVTPSAWSGGKAFEIGAQGNSLWSYNGNAGDIRLLANAYWNNSNYIYSTTAPAASYQVVSGAHYWQIAPSGTAGNAISFTQAMTLDASGNLLVGTTSTISGYTDAYLHVATVDGGKRGITVGNSSGSSGTGAITFVNSNGQVGYILTSGSTTTYATSSDYRLKNTIAPMTGALAKVAQLKPVTYKWNADGSDGEGFIAHELAEVVPHAVTGEKDAVDEEGNPKYQGIDVSFLVATLTAAIQELKAEFDAYKASHP